MIEVTFTESAGGSLMHAMAFGKGAFHPPAIAVIGTNADGNPYSQAQIAEETHRVEDEYRKKWKKAVPMEGSFKDVLCLALGLSLGDISRDLFGEERAAFLREMACIPDAAYDEAAREQMEHYRHHRDELLRRTADGEPVRLWYSSNPDEMCGFYHALSILPLGTDIRAIRLPEYTERGDSVRSSTSWGEICPENFWEYLQYEEKVRENVHRMLRFRWNQLVSENAPIRAVINGKLSSAGEGMYDFYILRELECRDEVFHEAHLIGDVLGKYQLGISDWYIHKRIRFLEAQGKLEPINQAPESPGYRRYLRKTRK